MTAQNSVAEGAADAAFGQFYPNESARAFDQSDMVAAIAKAADIVLVIDADGLVADVAYNVPELAAARVLSWVGRPFADIVTEDGAPKVERLMSDELNGIRRWRQVNHALSGSLTIPVEYSVIHIGDDGQRILAGRELTGIASLQQRLLSTQQSMEREYARVRGAEARYRTLFQHTGEAVLIVDAASERIVEANPAATELLAAKQSQSLGSILDRTFSKSHAAAVIALVATTRAAGSGEEVAVTLPNGGTATVRASLFKQASKSFVLLRLVGGAAGAGNGRGANLAELIDQLPEGFVICDANGTVLTANAAFLELTQLGNVAHVRGQPLSRWIGRTGLDASLLFGALQEDHAVRSFATVLRGEHGADEEVDIAAVATTSGKDTTYGLSIRTVRAKKASPTGPLEHSVDEMTELVGRVPLKDLVRDATDLIERLCIEAALKLTDNNRASAAELLGLSRQSLYNKMRRFELLSADGESEP